MASSMCDCNSSSISRFKRSPRTAFAMRDHKDMSCLPEDPIDGQTDGLPAQLFRTQLLFACRSQFVDAGAAARILLDPFRANPTRFLHPIQCWVERALLCTQDFAGCTGYGSHDCVAVEPGAPRQYLQHEQIERTLQRIRLSHT